MYVALLKLGNANENIIIPIKYIFRASWKIIDRNTLM